MAATAVLNFTGSSNAHQRLKLRPVHVRFRFMREHIVDNSSVFPEVWELEMFPTAKVIFIVTPCH